MNQHNRAGLALPVAIATKLAADPAAQPNLPAFVTVVVDYFVAFGRRIDRAQLAGARPRGRLPLLASHHVLGHYTRYARAAGGRHVGDLVSAALAFHYFGSR